LKNFTYSIEDGGDRDVRVQAGDVEGDENRGVLDVYISYTINEVDGVLHKIFGCEIRVRSEPFVEGLA